jgi:hypothetical protein
MKDAAEVFDRLEAKYRRLALKGPGEAGPSMQDGGDD